MTTPADRAIAREVLAERDRQDAKWGEQNHSNGTGSLADKERAEHAKNATDAAARAGRVTWRDIAHEEVCEAFAESDPNLIRAELVQASAVLQQWIAAIDRKAGLVIADPPRDIVTPSHLRIAFLLAEAGEASDTRLMALWNRKMARSGDRAWPAISDSGLRSRRAELVDWDIVRWAGKWGKTISGRPTRVWELRGDSAPVLDEAMPSAGRTPITGPLVFGDLARAAFDSLIAEAGTDVVSIAHMRTVRALMETSRA